MDGSQSDYHYRSTLGQKPPSDGTVTQRHNANYTPETEVWKRRREELEIRRYWHEPERWMQCKWRWYNEMIHRMIFAWNPNVYRVVFRGDGGNDICILNGKKLCHAPSASMSNSTVEFLPHCVLLQSAECAMLIQYVRLSLRLSASLVHCVKLMSLFHPMLVVHSHSSGTSGPCR